MESVARLEPELHRVLSFLAPRGVACWTATCKRYREHEANAWYLRCRLRPYAADRTVVDYLLRRAPLAELRRRFEELCDWCYLPTPRTSHAMAHANSILASQSFPVTRLSRTHVAKAVALAAVRAYGKALQWAEPPILADKEVVLAAVRQHGSTLRYAHPAIKADKEVVLAACQQDGSALEYAGAALRADPEVVRAAVRQTGYALEYAL